MINVIDFQVTATGSAQLLTSFSALAGYDRCAMVRASMDRSAANPGKVIGPNNNVMAELAKPVSGQPIQEWRSTESLPEGNQIPLAQLSVQGTASDKINITVYVR